MWKPWNRMIRHSNIGQEKENVDIVNLMSLQISLVLFMYDKV